MNIASIFHDANLVFPPAFTRVLDRALRHENVILAEGEPGTGKTTVGRLLGESILGDGGFFLSAQMHHWADDEAIVRGVDLEGFVENDPKKVYAAGVLLRALKLSQRTPRGVVLLDEWDKTRPAADALLYSVLQERLLVDAAGNVWGQFPEDVIFWITTNNMRPLSPPLLRRTFRLVFPPLRGKVLARRLQEEVNIGHHVAKLLAIMAKESRELGHPLTLPDLIRVAKVIKDADGVDDIRVLMESYGEHLARQDPAADLWAAVGRDRKARG